ELLRKIFPDRAANHVVAAVEFPSSPVLTPERVGALYEFARRAQALPHVGKVQGIVDPSSPMPKEAWAGLLLSPPPEMAPAMEEAKKMQVGARTVLCDVTTPEPSDSKKAQDLVRALRKERKVADGVLRVGGETANNVDTAEFLYERAPRLVL